MKYYKGRFMIAVYSLLHEGETLLALCDNVHEFARYTGTTDDYASVSLAQLFTGYKKYIKLDGKLRTVEFINVEED